ncbi:hypothetical protein [Bacteroides sp. 519]|nr:hypothetical protein [Bacteroides sp. 519]
MIDTNVLYSMEMGVPYLEIIVPYLVFYEKRMNLFHKGSKVKEAGNK